MDFKIVLKTYLCLLLFLEINCLNLESKRYKKLAHGKTDHVENAPYIVQIYEKNPKRMPKYPCAGVIMDRLTILTLASCLERRHQIGTHIVSGTSYSDVHRVWWDRIGVFHNVTEFIIHENYHPGEWIYPTENNIALIKLKHNITFNDKQKPIKIRSTPLFNHELLMISGFGQDENSVYPTKLRSAIVPIVDSRKCQNTYYYKPQDAYPPIGGDEFCAGTIEKHHTVSDSGSPAVDLHGELVGLMYRGDNNDPKPAVYINLINYRDWIFQRISYKDVHDDNFFTVQE